MLFRCACAIARLCEFLFYSDWLCRFPLYTIFVQAQIKIYTFSLQSKTPRCP